MTAEPAPPPRRRATRRLSTVAEVLETGLRVLSTEGLEAVSIRRLASELGLSPMAIYSYVKTKDELLDAIAVLVLGELEVEVRSGETWQQALTRGMTDLHDALRRHRGISDLLLSRPPPIASLDGFREGILSVLRGAGFSIQDSVDALTALTSYTLGYVHLEQMKVAVESEREARRLHALPAGQYPMLLEAADAYAAHFSRRGFGFGLRGLIEGLAVASTDD